MRPTVDHEAAPERHRPQQDRSSAKVESIVSATALLLRTAHPSDLTARRCGQRRSVSGTGDVEAPHGGRRLSVGRRYPPPSLRSSPRPHRHLEVRGSRRTSTQHRDRIGPITGATGRPPSRGQGTHRPPHQHRGTAPRCPLGDCGNAARTSARRRSHCAAWSNTSRLATPRPCAADPQQARSANSTPAVRLTTACVEGLGGVLADG